MRSTLFRNVDGFLAIGSANRDYYLNHGVPPDRIFMMPYAVDNQAFKPTTPRPSREEIAVEHRLEAGRPVILFAAKLQPRKRPWDLWKAYVRLSPNGVDEPVPYLMFVGEGSERAGLEAAVADRGWQSVRFVGFQTSQAACVLRDCRCFCAPSEGEPWGLAMNEAMNAETAVIVSDQVGAPSISSKTGSTATSSAPGT